MPDIFDTFPKWATEVRANEGDVGQRLIARATEIINRLTTPTIRDSEDIRKQRWSDRSELQFLVTLAEQAGRLITWVDAGILSDADACELIQWRDVFSPKCEKLPAGSFTFVRK